MAFATRRAASWATAAVALALTVGCDSEGGGEAASTPPTASTTARPTTGSTGPATVGATSPTTPATPATPSSPALTGTVPAEPAQAEQGVRAAWRVLFDPESSVDERSEVVEDGPQNALMIENLFADRLGSRLRAEVTTVAYTTSQDATVAYTLTRDGRRLATDGPGAAVQQDGTWKVALRTVCALTRHAEDAPQAPSCG
ncbi:hypothetical protein [Streptomyces sp. NPDC002328]|uniref:hypothetical protein n=1 Tax=Streptomyces sp. NPDC002328 TaxID=3364642 RepID=UPI0036A25325